MTIYALEVDISSFVTAEAPFICQSGHSSIMFASMIGGIATSREQNGVNKVRLSESMIVRVQCKHLSSASMRVYAALDDVNAGAESIQAAAQSAQPLPQAMLEIK